MKVTRIALGAAVAGVVLAGCTVSSSGGSSSNGSKSGSSQSKPLKTLLSAKGSGQGQTKKFTVGNEWNIDYSYNCANFDGQKGNFIISVEGKDNTESLSNQGADTLGKKGHATIHNHHGGTYYLSINSECAWHIKVRG